MEVLIRFLIYLLFFGISLYFVDRILCFVFFFSRCRFMLFEIFSDGVRFSFSSCSLVSSEKRKGGLHG